MKNILFTEALTAVKNYLDQCQGKETVYQFLTQDLIKKFDIDFVEGERLLNLMIQHDYLNRKDSFFTILISPGSKMERKVI